MPAAVVKKPKHVYALQVTRQLVGNSAQTGSDYGLEDCDWQFLREFLHSRQLKLSLQLVDQLTSGSRLNARIGVLRPTVPDERDSLQVLSDLWVELEHFVMQTREDEEPDAHELYDLLADPHIREVLVSYDDIANSRYVTEEVDLVPVYTVTEPANLMASEQPPEIGRLQIDTTQDDEWVDVAIIAEGLEQPKRPSATPPRPTELENPKPISVQQPPQGVRNVSELINRFEASQLTESSTRSSNKPSSKKSLPGKLSPSRLPQEQQNEEDSWGSVTSMTVVQNSVPKTHPSFKPEVALQKSIQDSLPVQPLSPSKYRPSKLPPSPQKTKDVQMRVRGTAPATSPTKTLLSDQGSPTSPHSKRQSQHRTTAFSPPPTNFNNYTNPPNRTKRHSHINQENPVVASGPPNTQSLSRHQSRQRDSNLTRPPRGQPGQVRLVRLRRDHPGEPIGITIAVRTPSPPSPPSTSSKASGAMRTQQPVLAIQRIMAGSLADRDGSLFPGDFLLEFNGHPVHSLDEVYGLMQQTSGALECEFLIRTPLSDGILQPGQQCKHSSNTKRYIRTFFDYDATRDALMPTGDVGLSFKAGEVLELINDRDPNWWQVRRLNDPGKKARLIPSQTLEERRTAFNQEKRPGSLSRRFKKRSKTFFRAADASSLRLRADLWSYEEVVPWPQCMIPCLLLLGPTGVGRRNLKVLLANREPKRFAYPTTDTTYPSASTDYFHLVSKSQMEADVRAGAYVEWGKANGHYYGIQFNAVRKIIASGRTAVFDCQPQTVYMLHQPEFNPCVVYVAAPDFEVVKRMMDEGLQAGVTTTRRTDSQLREIVEESKQFATKHRHLYFHKLINSEMHETVDKLSRLVTRLERQPSWIPSGWAYEMSVPVGSVPGTTFVPGSSSLSALGIQGLPPSRSSTIARSVLSGISEASTESAQRLARLPSICTTVGVDDSTRQRRAKPQVPVQASPLYERRKKPQHEFRPLSPAIPEQDTPTESNVSQALESPQRPRRTPLSKTRPPSISSRPRDVQLKSPTEKVKFLPCEMPSPSHDSGRQHSYSRGSHRSTHESVELRRHSQLTSPTNERPRTAPEEPMDGGISDTSTEAEDDSEANR